MRQIIILILLIMLTAAQIPNFTPNKQLYPFKSNYIELTTGKMHYVDEGKGDVILFLHGTPTWSFLYRDYIKGLSKNYRCIAIDHLGFGLSERPEEFDGTPQAHSKNLEEFITKLNLKNINLVVHDFGGPIGLSYAIKHANNIKSITLFNSWLWETKNDPGAQKIDRILNSGLGKFMYLRMNFSPKVLVKKAFYDQKKLSKKVHKHYINVFPNKPSRIYALKIGQSLVGSSDWYQEQWEKMDAITNKPWLILWGTKDEFINTEYLAKWKQRLPNAIVKEFEAGHFVQEEKTQESLKALSAFISR